jgi:hypothetical protein
MRIDHMTSENAFDSTCPLNYYIARVLILHSNCSTKAFRKPYVAEVVVLRVDTTRNASNARREQTPLSFTYSGAFG